MKRHLIYYTHVITNRNQKDAIRVKARVVSEENNSLEVSCLLDRISRDGMTLSCDESTLIKLMPKKSSVAPKNPLTLATNFLLDENIQPNCRVIFTRRLSKNQFVVELKFFELAERDMNLIDQFIEKSLNDGQGCAAGSEHTDEEKREASPSQLSYADKAKPSLHHLKVNSKPVFSKVA